MFCEYFNAIIFFITNNKNKNTFACSVWNIMYLLISKMQNRFGRHTFMLHNALIIPQLSFNMLIETQPESWLWFSLFSFSIQVRTKQFRSRCSRLASDFIRHERIRSKAPCIISLLTNMFHVYNKRTREMQLTVDMIVH